MQVILHVGAHRTATTSFQSFMRRETRALQARRIAFWGPQRTRAGLFSGIEPQAGVGMIAARRARARILAGLEAADHAGVETLIVSEENMIGNARRNLRKRLLYPGVAKRLGRYVCAFDGEISQIVLTVRALDRYWMSAAAFGITRGHAVLDPLDANSIAYGHRTWRDVVADIACAAPKARITVVPFERTLGRPDALLAACAGHVDIQMPSLDWQNRGPTRDDLREILVQRGEDPAQIAPGGTRWNPFDAAAAASLREAYADDLHWLSAGADGLARLTPTQEHTGAGHTPPQAPLTRGHRDDIQERRVARPGRSRTAGAPAGRPDVADARRH